MNAARILSIEPFPLLAEGLRALLCKPGLPRYASCVTAGPASPWEVCAVERCGLTALVTAGRPRPDIAIAEYELPDVDGLEIAQRLKELLPAFEVLLFCGKLWPCVLRRSMSRPCAAVFRSDNADEILFALETIRRRRRFRSVGFTEAWEKVAQTYDALATLTRCELETVRGVAGRQNKEIADERGRSVKTIDRHRANAVRKLRTRGLAELLRLAIGYGVVVP